MAPMDLSRIDLMRQARSRVTAIFPDSALSFALPEGATLGDLAERLAYLGERHGQAPLRVDVRIGAWRPRAENAAKAKLLTRKCSAAGLACPN